MKENILSLDQGTTSSRAIVFRADSSIAGFAQKEITQHYPQTGWVEHDPREIWQTTLAVARDGLAAAKAAADDLAAIGITNQRETTLVWDRKSGQPIYPAIVWQDRRTADLCAQWKSDGLEDVFQRKTGLLLDPYFSGTKIRWILDHVPEARERSQRGELAFGTVDSWLLWNLTEGQVHATDATNASRTLLFNIHEMDWDEELLQILDIPRAMLPHVGESSQHYGTATALPGFAHLPITGIAGDQQAALFGQCCFSPGMAKNTYGTGCFLLLNTGTQPVASRNQLLTTVAWRLGGETSYALEGSVFVGGAVIQWLRDGLGMLASATDSHSIASSVDNTEGVYLVPAFAGLGAPHWDPFARGVICGLHRGTTAAHLVRAALESIAFQSADLLSAMSQDAGTLLHELRVDGGASQNDFLMQFQADLVGVPVVRSQIAETTALGAAFLAGLAAGVWPDCKSLATHWREDHTFMPEGSRGEIHKMTREWHRALERSRNWLEPT